MTKPPSWSLALLLALAGCSYDWKATDGDRDGFTPDEGDCWDAVEGPPGSALGGADIRPGRAETWYDGVDQDCAGDSDYDQDQDGFDASSGGGGDCDDTDATINPSAVEVYHDGVDTNCDGQSDDDVDGDGADDARWGGEDCDDGDPSVGPSAEEIYYDGLDQNCDGLSDYDADGDGFDSDAYAVGPEADCDDGDPAVNPEADEIWYDGVDQDCLGDEDDDQDGDGYASAETGAGTDCDDLEAAIFPGAAEIWYDGVDQDCDGGSDFDRDLDGQDGVAYGGADCDDARANTYDGATEVCNLRDDNCDGTVDEGYSSVDAIAYYLDADSDGYGDPAEIEMACEGYEPEGYLLDATDCDDADPAAYPGAEELVGDEVDEDCDGAEICYQDGDGDAWRTELTVASPDSACTDPGEASASVGSVDCDDDDPSIFPTATEGVGDEVDQDCDGDEVCYVDGDGDGYRLDETTLSLNLSCADPGEAVAAMPADDCADDDPTVSPGASEITGDEVDGDCDGAETCYQDEDGDGYRVDAEIGSADADCGDPGEAPEAAPADDCGDDDPAIYPSATEGVGDEVDQDCDGEERCYSDGDGDGYRTDSETASGDPDCGDAGEAASADPDGDCDDGDPATWPGADEEIGDEVDQSCDGREICYADPDHDGTRSDAGLVTSSDTTCDDPGEGEASDEVDCGEFDASIYPGADEVIGDEIDQSCDGREICYADPDHDGYRSDAGLVTSSDTTCDDLGEGEASDGVDCKEFDADVHPGADEVCDGEDNDCDGTTDVGALDGAWYADEDGDGYGDPAAPLDSCSPPSGFVTDGTDCDDGDGAVYPGALEVCDGQQNDCDGTWTSDDGRVSFEAAADGAWTDLSDTFANGTSDAVAAARVRESGDLYICAGAWFVSLTVDPDLTVNITGREGAERTVLDGGGASGVLSVGGGGEVTVTGLTLQNGSAEHGAGLSATGDGADLTVSACVIADNVATGQGGGLRWSCEGVDPCGTLTLSDLTLSGNQADQGGGAALIGGGVATGSDLEVSGSQAREGGGLYLSAQSFTLSESILTSNESERGAGAYLFDGSALALSGVGVYGNAASASVGGVQLVGSQLTCEGDASDPRLGVFGNSGGGAPGSQISLDPLSLASGLSCDLRDPDAGLDGDIFNEGVGATYTYGADADFLCDASGC